MSGLDRLAKTRLIVDAALDLKAERPVALDVSEVTSFADVFVVLSGRSDRQVRAIADSIERKLKENGEKPLGVEGYDTASWILMDCNDVIVHVFAPETREHYDLERLWGDAPVIDLGPPTSTAQGHV